MNRVKVFSGWAAESRFMLECERRPLGYIPRCVRTPYAYSPTHAVMEWRGKAVILCEIAHRRFEVFEVPRADIRTEQEAEDAYIAEAGGG